MLHSIVMDSREAREIRIRRGGEWVSLDGPGSGQRNCGTNPGEWSTGLVRVQVNGQLSWSWPRTMDSWKKTMVSTDQDAVLRRHRNPRCSRCVVGPILNLPLPGKECLDTNPDTTQGALHQGGMRQIQ